jgi:hypothetical protein
MTTQCLCAGPYPTIEQQAYALRVEPNAPAFPIEHYIATCAAVNFYLIALLIEHARMSFAAMYGKDASKG